MKYNSGCMVCGADLVYSHELMYSQCSICGAGVGSGIFASVIKWATPLTKYSWGFSNKMTAHVLSSIGEIGGPRCCKRNSFTAIIKASEFLFDETGKKLFDFEHAKPVCTYKSKNKECIKMDCPFFLNK